MDFLYEFLMKACIGEGGDGWVLCVSPPTNRQPFTKLADEFEQWLKNNNLPYSTNNWIRSERMNSFHEITFSYNQEHITFASNDFPHTTTYDYILRLN